MLSWSQTPSPDISFAFFLAFSLASSLAFLLSSSSFCCCSILCSFHFLVICKCETVPWWTSLKMHEDLRTSSSYLEHFWRWVRLGILVDVDITGGQILSQNKEHGIIVSNWIKYKQYWRQITELLPFWKGFQKTQWYAWLSFEHWRGSLGHS